MASGFVIRKNQYYDSVYLMSVNRRIAEVKGVQQTAVLMGGPANKQLLSDIGIQDTQIDTAQPNDLIVAVIAETSRMVDDVLGRLDEWLEAIEVPALKSKVNTLKDGLAQKPDANLAAISIPGEYAAKEARKALEANLNTFVFSDNVSIEDELELKRFANQHGLIVMGPDCGTSLIGGVGLGFTNVVRKGSIGVIGGAGTGLQEFTCQVHNAGFGISHAIGTGSHDLSDKIGGLTTFAALNALESDTKTKVIAIIAKIPAPGALEHLLDKIETCKKPVVGCFLGIDTTRLSVRSNLQFATTIDDAVRLSIEAVNGNVVVPGKDLSAEDLALIVDEQTSWSPDQKYLRGILAGGTFCYQSQQILQEAGINIYSNNPLDNKYKLAQPDLSIENTIVDMGDDFYTVGKPHPMIDSTMRRQRILVESRDPKVAILFLDFILGYNASMDPVGDLVDVIQEAKLIYKQHAGALTIVASVCGTDGDPQDLNMQIKMLRETGVLVYRSNALASKVCCKLLGKEKRF